MILLKYLILTLTLPIQIIAGALIGVVVTVKNTFQKVMGV